MNSHTARAGTTYAEVGTNVVYAATHQFGRGAIPARPFLMLQDEDRPAICDVLRDYMLRPLL
jgi:phage gpG-like protein